MTELLQNYEEKQSVIALKLEDQNDKFNGGPFFTQLSVSKMYPYA